MLPRKVYMQAEEIKRIREKLGLDRSEMVTLLALSGLQPYKNIETGGRNPGKLIVKLLKYLDSLPKQKAKAFIEDFNLLDANGTGNS
jgi:DNA-binding transcriptional regulator YiaG